MGAKFRYYNKMQALGKPIDTSSMGSAASTNSSNMSRLNNSKHFTESSRISDAIKLYTTLGGGPSLTLDADEESASEEGSLVKNIAGIS